MTQYSRRTTPHGGGHKSPKWGRLVLASGLIFAGAVAVQAHDNEKAGPKIERAFSLSGFDEIDISGVYDVKIEAGEEFSVRLEGPEREMEYAEVERNGDTLRLGQKKKKTFWKNRKSITAYVTLPALNRLKVSGVADVRAENVKSDSFRIDISGVADIEISGECGSIKANISGVSDVDAKELICQHGEVNMSGVADLDIYTSESIDADVSGVGDVDVYGKPAKVEKSVSKYTASLTVK